MEKTINSCADCPFKVEAIMMSEQDWCLVDTRNRDIPYHKLNETTPVWCPLKKEPITIKLKS